MNAPYNRAHFAEAVVTTGADTQKPAQQQQQQQYSPDRLKLIRLQQMQQMAQQPQL